MKKIAKFTFLPVFLILFLFPFPADAQKIPVAKKLLSEKIINIDLYSAYQKSKIYPLSAVAESVEYLPLETNNECLLANIVDVTVSSKDIIVGVYEGICYHFNRQGKFLNVIGSIGKGPKEFTKLSTCVVDTVNRWVYAVDWEKLVKYDFEGNFLDRFNLGRTLGMQNVMLQPGQILMGNGRYQYAKPGERFSYHIFSEKNKKHISKIACEKKDKIPFCICTPSMYNYNNETYLSDFWNDTIYRVKDPNTLEAYAALDKGKFQYRSTEDKSILGGKNTGEERVIEIRRMAENDRFIFITTSKGTFFYDKDKKETYCSEFVKSENMWANFKNDITSVPFRILLNAPNSIQNGTLISHNDAYQFFEEGIDTNNPKIKKLLHRLQPDDNPVLVLVKLKE
ncbi:6-bladed beta-propeller [Maribellus maritimus]|uniref:6-bladed beta-propeller n=1 Tax=Maribellus maritimus TaxID=2870838 RepID=UPI001EEB4595|nr:6-bladed beta-propeller [Maribellus maritimus]MCG6189352.1 6-bladed beta-propeller [Maribellus maritimus]